MASKITGIVEDYGVDHYQHDSKNEKSFYLKINQGTDTKEYWGIQLEKEVSEKDINRGEAISLEKKGITDVKVKSLIRDNSGNKIGSSMIDAKRNEWEVTPISTYHLVNDNPAFSKDLTTPKSNKSIQDQQESDKEKTEESSLQDNTKDLYHVVTENTDQSFTDGYDAGRSFYNLPVEKLPFVLISEQGKGAQLMAKTTQYNIQGTDETGFDKTLESNSLKSRDIVLGYYDALAESIEERIQSSEKKDGNLILDEHTKQDLKNLAQVDLTRASLAWKENAGENDKTPDFLVDDVTRKEVLSLDDETKSRIDRIRKKEIDEYNASLNQSVATTATNKKQDSFIVDVVERYKNLFKGRSVDTVPERATEQVEVKTPKFIDDRYYNIDNKYYDKKQERVLAFQDKGNRLTSSGNNKEVIQDMVNFAKSKQWTSFKLSGTKDFRREAWLQAESQGIKTSGYTPTKLDMAQLQQLAGERATNKIEMVQKETKDKPITREQQLVNNHNSAIKNVTQNMTELRAKDTAFTQLPQDQLSKIAYWRGVLREDINTKPINEQEMAIKKFDVAATNPQFVKQLESKGSENEHDKSKETTYHEHQDSEHSH